MGYTTKFDGVLSFNRELTDAEILKLQSFNQENPDDHPNWVRTDGDRYSYIQWEVSPCFGGIQWDGSEKFYNSVEALNMVIKTMWLASPDLRLSGTILAQGEEAGDVWQIHIGEDGLAYSKEIPKPSDLIICPHCDNSFILSEARKE